MDSMVWEDLTVISPLRPEDIHLHTAIPDVDMPEPPTFFLSPNHRILQIDLLALS
jgi:hypothetical protein